MNNNYFVYILTNKSNSVIYTGVTNDIYRRIYEHTDAILNSFTKKYNVNKLIFVEIYPSPIEAIAREKYIKGKTRNWKDSLINSQNPKWRDLTKLYKN